MPTSEDKAPESLLPIGSVTLWADGASAPLTKGPLGPGAPWCSSL